MLSQGKIIYSRRFQQIKWDEKLYQEAEREAETVKKTPLWTDFKEHLRELEEGRFYVLREDKMEGRQRFIDLAERLSLDFEIDMDIREYDYYISVVLYLYCGIYSGKGKDMFSELLTLSDSVDIWQSTEAPFDMMLLLNYDTHDCCYRE